MKISDAILLIIDTEKEPFTFTRFDWYIGQMEKAGLIDRKPDLFHLVLTDKGKDRLRNIKEIIK